MSEPNQPTQNYEVTSPSLEKQVRSLLPSVAGYGGLLRSTNTIIPVIDLTTAAEGSSLPEILQTALAHGSQTSFDVSNTNTDVITNTGFWRFVGSSFVSQNSSSDRTCSIRINDGATTKEVWSQSIAGTAGFDGGSFVTFDLVLFLDTGHTANLIASTNCTITGSARQIATIDGTLVLPSGFTFT